MSKILKKAIKIVLLCREFEELYYEEERISTEIMNTKGNALIVKCFAAVNETSSIKSKRYKILRKINSLSKRKVTRTVRGRIHKEDYSYMTRTFTEYMGYGLGTDKKTLERLWISKLPWAEARHFQTEWREERWKDIYEAVA